MNDSVFPGLILDSKTQSSIKVDMEGLPAQKAKDLGPVRQGNPVGLLSYHFMVEEIDGDE